MRKKQLITVILEPTALIHCIGLCVPFSVRPIEYEGRKVLELEFRAFDCGFIPGGMVDVNAQRFRRVVCFEKGDVLEVRKSSSESEKNRLLCPSCHYASLKVISQEQVPNTTRVRYRTSCTRKGCTGRSSFE